MKSKWLFTVLLLMCGTAWGQDYSPYRGGIVYTNPDTLTWRRESVTADSLRRKESFNERMAREGVTADSLRIVRQVDIVLDYLRAQGYALPKIPAIGDSMNVKIK